MVGVILIVQTLQKKNYKVKAYRSFLTKWHFRHEIEAVVDPMGYFSPSGSGLLV